MTAVDTAPPAPEADLDVEDRLRVRQGVLQFVSRQYLVLVLLVICMAVGLAKPAFWGTGNLSNVLFQAAFVGLAACGMTLLIAGGLLDLSVGGVIAVASIAAALALPRTTIGGAVVLALVVGAVLGLVNGLLVTYVRIAPFIATLGTQYLYLGAAFIWTSGDVVPVTSSNYRHATNGTLGWLPIPFLVFVLLAIVTYLVLHHTYFGRTLRAFGSNERGAALGLTELGPKPASEVLVGRQHEVLPCVVLVPPGVPGRSIQGPIQGPLHWRVSATFGGGFMGHSTYLARQETYCHFSQHGGCGSVSAG